MRSFVASVGIFVALIAGFAGAAQAGDSDSTTDFCLNIPPDQAVGFVPLPEGDVFCPLIADPKEAHSFASYVRGSSSSPLGTDIGSVGIGDRLGIARWGGPRPGEGVQFGLEGAVFAQFDLNTPSDDLINADYLVGVPITLRRGGWSSRIRIFHQSSHLGDEFVLRSRIQRENFAFEAVEGILSFDWGPLRAYGGGEYVFNGRPSEVETRVVHGGVEIRPKVTLAPLGQKAAIRWVAAGDVKAVQQLDWTPAWSARTGFVVGPPRPFAHAVRTWSILGEYYDGPSPYGQFFHEDVKYYGVGLHVLL